MADVDQILLVLVPISIVGAVLNWSSFYSICKLTSYKHSFGYLSANQALADALHSTIFLLYFCPMALLDHSFLKQYSHFCGFILLFFYELSIMTHLAVSFNRFFSIWFPVIFKKHFDVPRTKVVIGVLWCYTLIQATVLYEVLCYFYFDEEIRFLTFTKTPFCAIIGTYGDFLKNTVIVTFMMSVDILNLIKVKVKSYQIKNTLTNAAIEKLSCRDRRFLRQTIIQGSVYMLGMITYFFTPIYFENRWILFFGTSFSWVAVHVADGLILLICNPEIRHYIFHVKTNVQVATVTM